MRHALVVAMILPGYASFVEMVSRMIDIAAVIAIVIGAIISTVAFLSRLLSRRRKPASDPYRSYRQGLGRAILLGLELLIAADIIRTVAVSPTLESLGVLAVLVLIRTFLSYTLQVEIEHRLPWQAPERSRSEPS